MESLEQIVARRQREFAAHKEQQAKKDAAAVAARNRAAAKKIGPVNREADRRASAKYGASLLSWHERAGAILNSLMYLANCHGKRGYAFPAQKTILDKMRRWYGVNISRSTLNRDLQHMEDNGLLKRTRRHKARARGGIEFNSTMYTFTRRGFRWLKAMRTIIFSTVFTRVSNLKQYTSLLRKKEGYAADEQPKTQASEAPDGAVLT